MVLDPIPQILSVHFFGSRPQPPTSHSVCVHHMRVCKLILYLTLIHTLCVHSYESVYPHSVYHMLYITYVYSVGSLKLYVSFAKEPYKRHYILHKIHEYTHSLSRARALFLCFSLARLFFLSLARCLAFTTTLPRRWGLGGGFFRSKCESERTKIICLFCKRAL